MELWRAQAGSGKTEAVVALIAETVRTRPLARVWVVLPSNRQRAQFRVRLLEHLREANLPALNVELFNFYSLNRRLLNLLRIPVRSLRSGARQSVLRRIAAREPLRTFEPVASTPGFAHAVGKLIAELKQSRVEPADFTQAIQNSKDEDLARIYEAYQTLLREHHLVDTEGEAWLALESLLAAADWDPKIELLAVDGFDQFTGVQSQLVQALDERVKRTVVTLTHVEDREEGVGRRFAMAEQALSAHKSIDLQHAPHPQLCVRHLLTHGFRHGAAVEPMSTEAAHTLALIESHSCSAEAAEVMRQIKRRLVLERVPPDHIMIVLRDWAGYQPALSSAAHEFGIPVSLQAGTPLNRHPITALLDSILSLPVTEFAFEAVIDVLRSPYVVLEGLPRELVHKVELAARKYNLRVGRETWDKALEAGARPGMDYRGAETAPILTPDEAQAASEALNRFFDALPVATDLDHVWNFVARVEEIIGTDPDDDSDGEAKLSFSLFIAEQARLSGTHGDDIAALCAIKDALKDLLLTEDLLAALTDDGGRKVAWREFVLDLRAALEGSELNASPDRSGRVLMTTATDARGAAHPHVYILGLSEGIFPAPLPNDPLYLDSESARLTHGGRPILRPAADRADDESLFFELIALARESLTLTRPSLDGGQAWPPSALWNAVTALLSDSDLPLIRRRIQPGRPPTTGDAASLPELAAAVQARYRDSSAYRDYILGLDPRRAAHVDFVQSVERARYSLAKTREPSPYPEHCGDLTAGQFHDLTQKVTRPEYPWSASTITNLVASAYRVFANKLLRLDELEDPAEGADRQLEGSLMHRILEGTYKHFQSPDRPIAPENKDEALSILTRVADEVFDNAIDSRELVPSPIWPQQKKVMVTYLNVLVSSDFSADSPVARVFGSGKRWAVVVEKHFGDEEHRPMVFRVGETEFRVTGTIDRIDCIEDGGTLRLVVIDYKSSSSIAAADVRAGKYPQLVLYTAALRQLMDDRRSPERTGWFARIPHTDIEVAGGLFWSGRTAKPLNVLGAADGKKVANESVTSDSDEQQVLELIAERIERLRTGDFRPLPTEPVDGRCSSFCTYQDLCRVCELLQGQPQKEKTR